MVTNCTKLRLSPILAGHSNFTILKLRDNFHSDRNFDWLKISVERIAIGWGSWPCHDDDGNKQANK